MTLMFTDHPTSGCFHYSPHPPCVYGMESFLKKNSCNYEPFFSQETFFSSAMKLCEKEGVNENKKIVFREDFSPL